MTKKFACRDIGLECSFSAEAASAEELMPKIAEHAKAVHSMAQMDEPMKAKVAAAIKDA
jgi:predicted small metal-binding protein